MNWWITCLMIGILAIIVVIVIVLTYRPLRPHEYDPEDYW